MTPDPTSLDLLHDVIAPPATPWWPPAPGWEWALGALAAAALIAGGRAFLFWQRNRYRREALAECRRCAALLGDPRRRPEAVGGLAVVLKRSALSAFPRGEVAALTGASWLAFLDRTGGTTDFSGGAGRLLEETAYDPRAVAALGENEARAFAAVVEQWLGSHRVNAATGDGA